MKMTPRDLGVWTLGPQLMHGTVLEGCGTSGTRGLAAESRPGARGERFYPPPVLVRLSASVSLCV